MILGVIVPAIGILLSEIILRYGSKGEVDYNRYLEISRQRVPAEITKGEPEGSSAENRKGLKMIAIGILFTGAMIGVLGLMAPAGKLFVLGVAFILLLLGSLLFVKSLR
jgi:hypothetical protein